jgi:hypothetical protein
VKACLLTFLLAAALTPQARPPRKPSAQTSPPQKSAPRPTPTPEPSTVALCALLAHPADYDGKRVRVRAQLSRGFEHVYLYDAGCTEYAVETTPERTTNVVWAEFGRGVERASEKEVYAKFTELTAPCCAETGWRDAQAEVVVIGRFTRAGAGKGFGHLSLYAFRLAVEQVEQAEPPPPAP